MMDLLQVVILGLLLGGVYALMASGLALMFGVMRIVNLAHGAFIVLSAYLSYYLYEFFELDPIISMIVSIPVFFFGGIALYMAVFPRIEGSKRFGEMTVLLSFGLALLVEGLATFFFTGIFRTVNPDYSTESFFFGDIFIPKGQFFASLVSLVLMVALGVFLKRSRLGYAIRATMQNRDSAQLVGVPVRRVSAISFGIGMSIAGAAGSLVSFLFPFFPTRHWAWIAILLSLIVVGGMGSIKGAVIAALVLSVMSSLVGHLIGQVWAPLVFFGALFITLIVRPQGLFGKVHRI